MFFGLVGWLVCFLVLVFCLGLCFLFVCFVLNLAFFFFLNGLYFKIENITLVSSKNVFEMLYAKWLEAVCRSWEVRDSMINNVLTLRQCRFFCMSFCSAFFPPYLLHWVLGIFSKLWIFSLEQLLQLLSLLHYRHQDTYQISLANSHIMSINSRIIKRTK